MFFAKFDDDGNKELTLEETGDILDAISDDEFDIEDSGGVNSGNKKKKNNNNSNVDMDDNAPVFGVVTEGDMQL